MITNEDDRFIPNDFMLRHRPPRPKKKHGFARKQVTPENATRQRLDAKYTARSNICPVCNCAMPATKECC